MSDWFKPDAIRSDIESTFTSFYYPAVYSAAVNYASGSLIRLGGSVYQANQAVINVAPPAIQWTLLGDACKVLYENVSSALDNSSMKIQLGWGGTSNESIRGPGGRLRRVDGVIGVWIFTPKGQGTSKSLRIASRVRETMNLWNRLGTCGEQVMIYDVNGPRSADSTADETHLLQILSASLVVLEKVS